MNKLFSQNCTVYDVITKTRYSQTGHRSSRKIWRKENYIFKSSN